MITKTLSGIHYLSRGFQLLAHPRLRLYVIIPLFINILLFIGFLAISIHFFQQLTQWVDTLLPSWLLWLNWLLWIFFVFACFIVLAYTFTLAANIIAAPFNSLLAEKVQQLVTGKEVINTSLWTSIKDIPRSIGRIGLWLLYYLPRVAIALLLFFIPGINIIAPIVWFLFSGWAMAIQYIDYPMDNNHCSFKTMRKQLETKRLFNTGFGCSILIATMIPLVNFFIMPAAVISATLLWVDHYGH